MERTYVRPSIYLTPEKWKAESIENSDEGNRCVLIFILLLFIDLFLIILLQLY